MEFSAFPFCYKTSKNSNVYITKNVLLVLICCEFGCHSLFYDTCKKNLFPQQISFMIEYSKSIAENWKIPEGLAGRICEAYKKGDSPYYLFEYVPQIAMELTYITLWEIYDFLGEMQELSSKKKRAITGLKKADKLTPALERQIAFITKAYEIDDLTISLKPNARSRGQVASKKGLGPLVDVIAQQQEEKLSVEELASEYVGKDPSLKSTEDVLQGVKDILAERFSFDETVRTMAREFFCDDGFFEIVPKNKKDSSYAKYVGKLIPLAEISKEELLQLLKAEDAKTVKVKINVQLFRISELLRNHFIINPDSTSFDIICEAVDEMWSRLLHPIAERDIKEKLRKEAESWVVQSVFTELQKVHSSTPDQVHFFVRSLPKNLIQIAAINNYGDLLGATSERKSSGESRGPSEKLIQFYQRHKPVDFIVIENDQEDEADSAGTTIISKIDPALPVKSAKVDRRKKTPADSSWMDEKFGLDPQLRQLYGQALLYLKPIKLVPQLGAQYYSLHPLENIVPGDRFSQIVNRVIIAEELKKSLTVKDLPEELLVQSEIVTKEQVQIIRSTFAKGEVTSKEELKKVKGITETVFRNIAGFLVVPASENLLDRSTVHPDYYPMVTDLSEQINVSVDTMISSPEVIETYVIDEPVLKFFVQNRLVYQLSVAQRFSGPAVQKIQRKLKLSELVEGSVVSGRVTNVTKFGVFININAVCDGLIHISQLADEYVETPDQVVSVGDKVDVRILKVDVKKRRISLTMKNMGKKAPKVRPSKDQLDNLADYFKAR